MCTWPRYQSKASGNSVKTSKRTGQPSGSSSRPSTTTSPSSSRLTQLVDERDEDVGAVRRPHRQDLVGGRLEHVAHLADQAAGGGAHRQPQEVADAVVGQRVQFGARRQQLAALQRDGLLARAREVEKHERAPVRPAHARHRAGPGLTGALFSHVETLAELEPVEPAGREIQVELSAESVDLAEDSAGPERRT